MKTSKKPLKDKKSFSCRLGEICGNVVGTMAGTFASPPSPVDKRKKLEQKGKARLKVAKAKTTKKRP